MAKKKRSKKAKSAKSATGHVPLHILETRLARLNHIVDKRGGDSYKD